MKSFAIGNHQLDGYSPTLVVAEIGVNHDGSIDRALQLVRIAADCGANAVKLQIFRATSLLHETAVFAGYQQKRCNESSPAEMLARYELTSHEIEKLVAAIRQSEMIPIATPFSVDDLETIKNLKLPAIKIASPDLVNQVLLKNAANCGTAMLISTGAATIDEVHRAAQWLKQWDASFALLHCVSSYPAPLAEAHIGWINELSRFGVPVGYSDHTTEVISGALAVALGASVIEKHLTYHRSAVGPDHAASADPRQFTEYVKLIRQAEQLRGRGGKCVLPIERDVRRVSRQSLVLRTDLTAGQALSEADLVVQRPGTGISPADFAAAIGRRARQPLKAGTLLQWDMLTDAA